ncbi:MAG: DUF4080 domain-containing protein [Spirochaetaceae bacterium]|nr:MAG: DUF4080 domain-containing protein [Spirochaetaceae bacterium]
MNAVLLGINGRFSHTNLALRYLRNEIRAAGHTAQIVEFDITTRRQDVLERLALAQPQVLLLSVYVWNALLIRLLLPDIRALLPACRLILGGPEVSYSAAAWIEAHPEIDVIVTGHAEQALRHLAASGFECEKRVVSVPNRSFAAIPFPYLEEDFAGLSHRYVYYESSRGCPCSCSYCVSGRDDQAADFRSVQMTCDELQRIMSQEHRWPAPPIVKLVDRTFNARPTRARAIWRYLIGAETNATFHFEVHPAFLSDEDLELLAGAPPGRFQFEIGVQSVHRATLRSVGRAQNWQRVRPRVQRLIEAGTVAVHLDLIAGLPREDIAQLARSIDDIMALKPTRFDLGFLKSLPGTAIRAQSEANGQLAMRDPPYQVLQNRWLTLSDFSRLRRIGELIDALWNSCRLEAAVDALALQHGGYYGAFDMLQRRAGEIGYNLATRQAHKVAAFLDASR